MRFFIHALLLMVLFTPAGAQDRPSDYAALFDQKVDMRLQVPELDQAAYLDLLRKSLTASNISLESPQFVLLVDSSDSVQAAMLFWISPAGPHQFIGASPVSTGKPGRFDHFRTPPGVYLHSPANPDYRAEGTRNEYGIRGNGIKGMRVYDFGWQLAIRGWGKGGQSLLRLQVHATDPDLLERLLGVSHSKGCVRIPATLNTFLDHYGILDSEYELDPKAGPASRVLLPSREPSPWAGRYLIVIDSGKVQRPVWSPLPTPLRKEK